MNVFSNSSLPQFWHVVNLTFLGGFVCVGGVGGGGGGSGGGSGLGSVFFRILFGFMAGGSIGPAASSGSWLSSGSLLSSSISGISSIRETWILLL